MAIIGTSVEVNTAFNVGPCLQCQADANNLGIDSDLPANQNVTSFLVYTNGYKVFSFALTSTKAGTLEIQRYLDTAGTIRQGAVITGSITANTPLVLSNTDGRPFQTMRITISNSEAIDATLSGVMLLLQSS